MKLYNGDENYKLYNGNMLDMADVIKPESIDSIVTDPPYELNFMNKGWDNSGIAFQKDTWKKCYEVLKPGGYLLAFGGSRTFHRIACAIEDAGFEIRDTIMWIYGSGFPKSLNIGLAIDKRNGVESKVVGIKEHCKKDFKEGNLYAQDEANKNNTKCFGYGTEIVKEAQNEWAGWGTQLKPSYEPIIVARKPCEKSIVDNVIKYGVGAINIEECRIETNDDLNGGAYRGTANKKQEDAANIFLEKTNKEYVAPMGRFPANTILTYDNSDFEEVCGGFPDTKSGGGIKAPAKNINTNNATNFQHSKNYENVNYASDSGSASRYFYCAKASKRDRDEGLDEFEEKKCSMMASNANIDADGNFTGMLKGRETTRKNTHPTVKPTSLMQYLVRLVTPKGGTVLDPFNGSGSTGKAVMYENVDRFANYKYIGIELTEDYLPIAQARIEFAEKEMKNSLFYEAV